MFPVKFFPSAQWRVEKRKDRKKWKISIFRKYPKLSLILSEHVLNLFWGNIFSKKNRQCTLEGRGLEKTLKKGKTSKFSKLSKNVPKKHCLRMFWLIFSTEKALPSAPWRLKKIHRNGKNFKVPKSRKSIPKVSKLARGNFFDFFLPTAPWRVETWKKSKKKRKKMIFRKRPKTFLKVSKQVLNLFVCNFSEKHAQCTL